MEDADDSPVIYFDVVRLDSTHWRVHVAGVPQLVSFTSRDGAAAAARAQARQFYLYRGLPTQVRIVGVDGTIAHTNCYNHNTLNDVAFAPLATRSMVSQRDMLASDTWLENDVLDRRSDPAALFGIDMEMSYRADHPPLPRRGPLQTANRARPNRLPRRRLTACAVASCQKELSREPTWSIPRCTKSRLQ